MAQDGENKAIEAEQEARVEPADISPVVAQSATVRPESAELVADAAVAMPVTVKPARGKAAKPQAAKAAPVPAPVTEKAKAVPRRKPVNRKKIAQPKPTEKAAKPKSNLTDQSVQELKEKIMATAKKTKPEYAKLLETAQVKAKEAYAKGAAVAGEVGAFSKGNVEAVIASGKILGAGVQALGKDCVAESKGVVDTFTADLKELAAVKSPTELFQLQGKLARRNFDQAVAFSSKTSEQLVKLANEVFAPISNRVSLAVDKISKAA